ncbi:MAG: bifunctional hydroxymethylpyrimidine kinase/phosphomethylpyrimidine kinase [Bacteroidales bacterium]|nr:bifunctional hydroxymethylpyrimidine kinase/phosphomethylpyrimidine kinase [Bacteroidales bacterium]
MKTYPIVLSVAGSDSSGGAGIQADLKTFSALGTFGTTAITTITAQNTLGVKAIQSVNSDVFQLQLEAVMSDFSVAAVKVGMLHSTEIVEILVSALKKYKPPYVVVDPVMVATSGDSLIMESTIESMKTLLFPIATVITPNLKEASLLLHSNIESLDDMKKASRELLKFGSQSALVKGGHLKAEKSTDVLSFQQQTEVQCFEADWIESNNLHGTGCTLSSAIAAYLALGLSISEAVGLAKKYVHNAILHGKDVHIGQGHGPLNHAFDPQKLKVIIS